MFSIITCPNCGKETYAETPRCPHCGEVNPLEAKKRLDERDFWRQPPPRKVPNNLRSHVLAAAHINILLGSFAFLIGIVLAFDVAPRGVINEIALDVDSTAATGLVLDSYKTGTSINDKPIYRVEFEFEDSNHIAYRNECFSFAPMSPGKEVSIEHSPRNPDVARIKGCSKIAGGYGASFVVIVPILAIAWIAYAMLDGRKTLKLLETGAVAEGSIVACWLVDDGEHEQWYVQVTFIDGTSTRTDTFAANSRLSEETPVHVFYYPGLANPIWVLELNSNLDEQ